MSIFQKLTICFLVIVVMTVHITVIAEESSGKCGDHVYWNMNNDGELTIYGDGDMWDNNYDEVKEWCTKAKRLNIEKGVTRIGSYAFAYCSKLESVSFSDSIEEIGAWAFSECSNLVRVQIPEQVTTICKGTFYKCSSLASVEMHDSIEEIDDYAFSFCSNLRSVMIPIGSLIGNDVFPETTQINISESVINSDDPTTVTTTYVKEYGVVNTNTAELRSEPGYLSYNIIRTCEQGIPVDVRVVTYVDGIAWYYVIAHINGNSLSGYMPCATITVMTKEEYDLQFSGLPELTDQLIQVKWGTAIRVGPGEEYNAISYAERETIYHYSSLTSEGWYKLDDDSYINASDVEVLCGSSKEDDGIAINRITFPSDALRNYVIMNADQNKDGILDDAEIARIETLNLNGKGLTSLKGVEHFTSLKTLYCAYNYLTSIKLSNNSLLSRLVCNNNRITELNLHANSRLEHLNCNSNQLTYIDVSDNLLLKDLYCQNNELTTLNVSNCSNLRYLRVAYNQLTSIDLSNNNRLRNEDVNAFGNYYSVDFVEGKFDLISLPGAFDPTKAYNWQGAVEENGILTLTENSDKVSFYYSCSDMVTVEFKLYAHNIEIISAPVMIIPEEVLAGQELSAFLYSDDIAETSTVSLYHISTGKKELIDQFQLYNNVEPITTTGGKEIFEPGEQYQFEAYSTALGGSVRSEVAVYPLTVTGSLLDPPELHIENTEILLGDMLNLKISADNIDSVNILIQQSYNDQNGAKGWLLEETFSEHYVTGQLEIRYAGDYYISASVRVDNRWSQWSESILCSVESRGVLPNPTVIISPSHLSGADLTGQLTDVIPNASYRLYLRNQTSTQYYTTDTFDVDPDGHFTIPGYQLINGTYGVYVLGSCKGYRTNYAYSSLASVEVSGDQNEAPVVSSDHNRVMVGSPLTLSVYAPGSSQIRIKGTCSIGSGSDEEWNKTYNTEGDYTSITLYAPLANVHDSEEGEWSLCFSSADADGRWSEWSDPVKTVVYTLGRLDPLSLKMPGHIYAGEDLLLWFSHVNLAERYEITLYISNSHDQSNTITKTVSESGTYTFESELLPINGTIHVEVVASSEGYVPSYGYGYGSIPAYGYGDVKIIGYIPSYSYGDVNILNRKYLLAFDTVGGNEIDSLQLAAGAVIPSPENPVKQGYIFQGWDPEIPNVMPAKPLTVVAQWLIRCDIVIPSSVKSIAAEAFTNIGTKNIYIPSEVNSIAEDAFDKDVILITEEGSYAWQWATDNGYTVVEK